MTKKHLKKLGYKKIHVHPSRRVIDELFEEISQFHNCLIIQRGMLRHFELWVHPIPKGSVFA